MYTAKHIKNMTKHTVKVIHVKDGLQCKSANETIHSLARQDSRQVTRPAILIMLSTEIKNIREDILDLKGRLQ